MQTNDSNILMYQSLWFSALHTTGDPLPYLLINVCLRHRQTQTLHSRLFLDTKTPVNEPAEPNDREHLPLGDAP